MRFTRRLISRTGARRAVPLWVGAAAVLLVTTVPAPAVAHVFGADGAGFVEGVWHPLSGVDHVLAMVAVGLWAAQLGGRAVWSLPAAFPVAMMAGAMLAMNGITLPLIETGIAASVASLGVVVALALRLTLPLSVALVGIFAVFHGHAHGAELPEAASPWLYSLGFVFATLFLHGIGLATVWIHQMRPGPRTLRTGGTAIATIGLAMLIERLPL